MRINFAMVRKQAREIHRLERTEVGGKVQRNSSMWATRVGRTQCAPAAHIGDSPTAPAAQKGYEKCNASGICVMTRAPYQTPRPSYEIGGRLG